MLLQKIARQAVNQTKIVQKGLSAMWLPDNVQWRIKPAKTPSLRSIPMALKPIALRTSVPKVPVEIPVPPATIAPKGTAVKQHAVFSTAEMLVRLVLRAVQQLEVALLTPVRYL
jgi:hypothetical protein